jgi:hypothetical protein
MTIADIAWGGLLLAGAGYETYALITKRPGDTFSETTRRAFRVRTRPGALAFGTLWVSFSTWFLGHILWGWPFPGS